MGTNPRTHRGDSQCQHPPRDATFSKFQPGCPKASIFLQELPPGQVWLTWAPFHPHPRRAERARARYVHGRLSRHLLGQETRLLLLQKLPRAPGKGRVNFAAEMEAQPGIAKRQKQKMFFRTDGVCYKLRSGAISIFSSTKKEARTSGGKKKYHSRLLPPKSLKHPGQMFSTHSRPPSARSSHRGIQRQSRNFTNRGTAAKPGAAANFLF